MKKTILLIATYLMIQCIQAQVTNPKDAAKSGATDHVNNNIQNGVDNSLNKTENAIKGLFKKKNKNGKTDSTAQQSKSATTSATTGTSGPGTGDPAQAAPSLKTYQNYDFVPGDKILFEDDFSTDQDGEFPAHWSLEKGQAVVNKVGDVQAFFLTEGNYAAVAPRMKTPTNYLPANFTIEFDFYQKDGGTYSTGLLFQTDQDGAGHILFGKDVSTSYFTKDFSSDFQGYNENTFYGKWHHAAMIKKDKQIKAYIDQYRVMVMPDCDCNLTGVQVGGIGSSESPLIFRNFRIAAGGGMNVIGKKFTDAKIVTHGINFDVDKATIKPESMGTLNMIVQVLKDNPDVKFEIDGHTDNTGTPQHNKDLSQQRADAVKTQLISLGVDASRLTSKGFGDTKPISDNNTFEGKANNRRVEFVKM
jgi:outer membrane protein OmpA-like peptidoglycan-associated protein